MTMPPSCGTVGGSRTRSCGRSAVAAWAACTWRATRASAGPSHSRRCRQALVGSAVAARAASTRGPRSRPALASRHLHRVRARGSRTGPSTSRRSTSTATRCARRFKAGDRPSPDEVRRTALEIAQALAGAHARGVTHRDLKPDNIMRTADGRVKLVDFGLALVDPSFEASMEGRLTQSGMLIGTPAYMAPEQLNGQPADFRSDVFAYGVVVYEFACGRHPFEAPSGTGHGGARARAGSRAAGRTATAGFAGSLPPVIARCLKRVPASAIRQAASYRFGATPAIAARRTLASAGGRVARWWRTHQLSAIGLYLLASVVAWQIKEWHQGVANASCSSRSGAARHGRRRCSGATWCSPSR